MYQPWKDERLSRPTVYPQSGHLPSCKPSAGQGKFADRGRCSTYCAMQPTYVTRVACFFFTVEPVRTVCVSFCCIVALFCWFLTQFLRGIQFQRVAPKVHGTCGRLVVMEHGGQPLTSYLDELFVDRAELAMQLLSMVQVFWVRLHFRFFTLRSQHLCFQIFVWWVLPVVMVPICTECWCTEAKETTQTHCYNPVAPAYPIWAYYAHERQCRCQEDSVSLPIGRLEKTTGSSPHHVAQHRPTGSETTPPYTPRSSRFGSEPPSVVLRNLKSCMPETMPVVM